MMWMDAVWNLKDRDDVIQMYLEDTFDRVMEIREKIQWSVKAICFSKTAYSVPMWAHYANEHRGIVLAYKRDKLIHAPLYDERGNLSPRDVLIKDINYSDARVDVTEEMHTYCNKGFQVFEEENDSIPELSNGKIRQSVLTKTTDWAYEKEARIIPKRIVLDEYSLYDHLNVKPDAIILGGLCNETVEGYERVVKYATKKNIPLFKVVLLPEADLAKGFGIVKIEY